MSPLDKTPVAVPRLDEVRATIVPSRREDLSDPGTTSPLTESEARDHLSHDAGALLRSVAEPGRSGWSLERHWEALGISSGSVKERVLDALRSQGFIRLERKGYFKQIFLYEKAWNHLGVTPPTGKGSGGATHRGLVESIARQFKARGYEIHVECPLGPKKKRVDLVAFGKKRIGIEVGLSEARHEAVGIREDLNSGALDEVLFCSTSPALLKRVENLVADDPTLAPNRSHIRFHLIEEA